MTLYKSRIPSRKTILVGLALCALLGTSLAAPAEEGGAVAEKQTSQFTFIELGSVNCVPCKAMQPVMTDIETSYKGKVKVLFYDVWTKGGEPFGKKYGIRVIPTQVFLGKDGKEFYRHEGFFLASDIKKMLAEHGIEP
jgi:thioredoxin 1